MEYSWGLCQAPPLVESSLSIVRWRKSRHSVCRIWTTSAVTSPMLPGLCAAHPLKIAELEIVGRLEAETLIKLVLLFVAVAAIF